MTRPHGARKQAPPSPTTAGTRSLKTATLRIANNDGDENPLDIPLRLLSLNPAADNDRDVIASSACPWQTSPGIETIETGARKQEVTQFVMDALAKTRHVKPTVYLDTELYFLTEAAAPGITDYRSQIHQILSGWKPEKLEHEKIIT